MPRTGGGGGGCPPFPPPCCIRARGRWKKLEPPQHPSLIKAAHKLPGALETFAPTCHPAARPACLHLQPLELPGSARTQRGWAWSSLGWETSKVVEAMTPGADTLPSDSVVARQSSFPPGIGGRSLVAASQLGGSAVCLPTFSSSFPETAARLHPEVTTYPLGAEAPI